jgi:lipoate-protein ligase B
MPQTPKTQPSQTQTLGSSSRQDFHEELQFIHTFSSSEPVSYTCAIELMNKRAAALKSKEAKPVLMATEHPPTLTAGRRFDETEVLIPMDELARRGFGWFRTDRGGKLTLHGPGQLVLYFVMDIRLNQWSVSDLVLFAISPIRDWLQGHGVSCVYDEKHPGLWVNNNKIAAVGFHLSQGISTHGVSLNLTNNLEPYHWIIPCGIHGRGVTRLSDLLPASSTCPNPKQAADELWPLYKKNWAAIKEITCF